MSDEKRVYVGGQAVIEGVMMRNNSRVAIAVRKGGGGIAVIRKDFSSIGARVPFLKWPVFRGAVAFVEALVLGIQCLASSAEEVLDEEEEQFKWWELPLTIGIAMAAGIGLFILLPTFLVRFMKQGLEMPLLLNLLEGGLRLTIFLGYVFIISRWKEVGRIFQYHGAEHKAIACYEAGRPLDVDCARLFSPLHRRCGTSFLLIVMVTSIVLFSFFGWPELWQRILIRLSLLPLVAGISYEAIRLAAAKDNLLSRLISQPGLWLQMLTTKNPADDQLEVAICALKEVLPDSQTSDPGKNLEVI